MRLLYAILCVLLIAWAAFGQSPAQHPRKAPKQHPAAPEKKDGPWNNPSCRCDDFPATRPCGCENCKAHCFTLGNGAVSPFAAAPPVTVCQNGVCGVISPLQTSFSGCSNGSCSTGSCSGSAPSGGWYPGKLLGRRR